jgi:hypothetical protein
MFTILRGNRSHRSSGRPLLMMRKSSIVCVLIGNPVTEKFLAFSAEKTAGDGNAVIALLEDNSTGDGEFQGAGRGFVSRIPFPSTSV